MQKRFVIYLLLASVAWGSTFPLAKVLLAKISPLTYIIMRLVTGIPALVLILAQRKSWGGFKSIWHEDRRLLLLLGLVITPASFLLEFNAILYTTAVNQSIIINLQAVVVLILQVAFYKRKVGWRAWAGSIIAFFGVYLVIARPGEPLFSASTLLGDILTLVTAVAWGFYTAVGEKLVRKQDPLVSITAIFSLCLLVFLPLWGVEGSAGALASLDWTEWLMLVYLGVICTGIAYWVWYEACRVVPAEQVAMYVYVSPLVAIAMGVLWLGELFTWAIGIGFVITILGLMLSEKDKVPEVHLEELPSTGMDATSPL
ncbi:MAG TPA: DMT family transporter [Candidatus Lokiarchaeia archaeon]|nr:DMT family transporter [Candidatus Lokiarchaeia archaeon]